MAASGSSSLKRSKPNYIYSIVGVAIVLFIMGIMGWLFLNLHAIGDNFKEDIRISVYTHTTDKNTIGEIQQFIAGQDYAKNVEYIDKEKAKAIWNKENNEEWSKILDINPLPENIDFFAKAAYVNIDSLTKISAAIEAKFKNKIADIQYPKSLVTSLNERTTKIGFIFLVLSIILCIIVIISIDESVTKTEKLIAAIEKIGYYTKLTPENKNINKDYDNVNQNDRIHKADTCKHTK